MINTNPIPYVCKCGAQIYGGQFCPNCGEKINWESGLGHGSLAMQQTSTPTPTPAPIQNDPEIKSEMLVDYCRKTLATGCGDSHDEMVLGLAEDGTYQIDVYRKDYNSPETHKLYKVPEQAKIDAYAYIEEKKLLSLENIRGYGLCGGDYVVKFKKDDGTYARITSANIQGFDMGVLTEMGTLLAGYVAKAIKEQE